MKVHRLSKAIRRLKERMKIRFIKYYKHEASRVGLDKYLVRAVPAISLS